MQADVIKHIGFSLDNRSNFDIRKSELDHIVDIPVFPAQNLIVDTQNINIYNQPSSSLPSLVHNGKIYYLTAPASDQRFVFIEYDNGSRLLDYRFGGRTYAQSRTGAGYSLSADSLYLFGGNLSNKEDMRDLWRFDLNTWEWIPEFLTGEDLSINDFMSKRRSSNLTVASAEKFVFGGRSYVEIGNTVITLNDLWWNDGVNWKVLDSLSLLPHSSGLVVWFDNSIIKILADTKIWTVYKDGITATTSVTYAGTVAAPPTDSSMSFYSEGVLYWVDFVSGRVYYWNNTSSILVVSKTASGVGYNGGTIGYYSKSTLVNKKRGNSNYQPDIKMHTPIIYNWINDTVYKTCELNAIPFGSYMASCDIDGGKKYLGLGLRETTFIEDHHIWDGNTNQTIRVGSDSVKPQERMYASSCYDAKRNRIWLFGGYTGSIYYNDLWYMSLVDYTWTRVRRRETVLIDAAGNPSWPAARCKSGICVVEDTLWIVAGYSDERSYADMWMYDINEDFASTENTTDWIQFGSDYFLFQWRDRLWLFNGEYKLYRYFYEYKQFAEVTLYATRYPDIQKKINDREYITPPMKLSVQNNKLIISHLITDTNEWFSFYVDLDSKEIIKYPGYISTASMWMDQTQGMDTAGYLYFYNISDFELIQRNTFPYYEYSVDPVVSPNPLSKDSSLMYYWDTDIVGGGGVQRLSYLDSGNMYLIYDDQIQYQPLLPTNKEFVDGTFSSYWPQMDYSVLDGTTGSDQILSKTTLGAGRFRTIPRFSWKRIPSGYSDKIRKAAISWFDAESNHTFIVNDQNGNILRYRAEDGTFFNYPSKLWSEGTAVHRGNILYCFGGNNQIAGAPPGLNQAGNITNISTAQWEFMGVDTRNSPRVLSHFGLMMYDLNYISFQLRLLQTNKNLTPRNYDQIRDYLVSVARSQLNVNVTGTELNNDWLDIIANSIYSDTISVVGDLSVRNIVNETGSRPFGTRVAGLSVQIGQYVYYGGGSLKWGQIVKPPCGGDEPVLEIRYNNYFPIYNQETGRCSGGYYNDFYRFDTDTKSWIKLANLPYPLYGAGMIVSPSHTKIYVVGGFTGNDLSGPSNRIWYYDILQDSWNEIKTLPRNYSGRALPLLEWLDDDRLLIMFGIQAEKNYDATQYVRIPIPDAWLLDKNINIMYKLFENYSKTSMILDSAVDIDGYIHMIDYSKIWFSNIYDRTSLDKSSNRMVTLDNQKIINSDKNEVFDDNSFPVETLPNTPNTIIWTLIDPVDGNVKRTINIDIPNSLASNLDPTNVVKDFIDTRGDLWLVVNQKVGETLPDANNIKDPIYNLYLYKATAINDWNYSLAVLSLDVPINSGVKLVGYDGLKHLYCIWNEFNIWQLDLDIAIFNPNGTYWRRMPPYPDLAEFGMWGSNDTNNIYTKSEPLGDEILFYNDRGLIARFDPINYVWRVDRYGSDQVISDHTVVKDGLELYYYQPGSTSGSIYGIEHRQEDKFYFEADLLENTKHLDLPVFDAVLNNMGACLSAKQMRNNGLPPTYSDCVSVGCSTNLTSKILSTEESISSIWEGIKKLISTRRSLVKRNQILAFNKNNHLMSAWTRKHGDLDLYMSFDSYYKTDKIDVSVDYDTMHNQANKYLFTCWTDVGIVTGNGFAVPEDTGYDWNPFNRIYRKQVELSPSEYTYIESERPGYFVRFNLPPNSSLNKIHIQFQPLAYNWNYVSRLNHITLAHNSDSIGFEDDDGFISVLYIEPFNTVESDVYQVRVVNNHSSHSANNVRVYLVDNYRVLLSSDTTLWIRSDLENQLSVSDQLSPGQSVIFYMKAVSYMDKSNLDLVVRAEFPPD